MAKIEKEKRGPIFPSLIKYTLSQIFIMLEQEHDWIVRRDQAQQIRLDEIAVEGDRNHALFQHTDDHEDLYEYRDYHNLVTFLHRVCPSEGGRREVASKKIK